MIRNIWFFCLAFFPVSFSLALAPTSNPEIDPKKQFILLGMIVAVFYFLSVRPQQKKLKQHQTLMRSLSVGDEVVTSGGILGIIKEIQEQTISLSVDKETILRIQKNAIIQTLPKKS